MEYLNYIKTKNNQTGEEFYYFKNGRVQVVSRVTTRPYLVFYANEKGQALFPKSECSLDSLRSEQVENFYIYACKQLNIPL